MILEANSVAVQWLLDWYLETRKKTLEICQHLTTEDHVVQSSPDVSPPSWHLGHTTWFFETFILQEFKSDYLPFDEGFAFIFNSYYESAGQRIQKANRGLLGRPTVAELHRYRQSVDESIEQLLSHLAQNSNSHSELNGSETGSGDGPQSGFASEQSGSSSSATEPTHLKSVLALIELGIHHEKQHQELLLMDIKHNFFCHPLYPIYGVDPSELLGNLSTSGVSWLMEKNDPTMYHTRMPFLAGNSEREKDLLKPFFESAFLRNNGILFDHGGPALLGHGKDGFGYDNEFPEHPVYQVPFWIASEPVSNGDFLEFLEAGGYNDFRYWLSAGWQWVQENEKSHPYYWRKKGDTWQQWSLQGWVDLDPAEPVQHLSYYESDAYSSFAGKRLPTEAEWELAARLAALKGFPFHRGRVWEWTASAYRPYPGFKPAAGAVGEYNGKFMMDQMVLRGACDLTPLQHSRITYRNFYPASSVWQMSGLRLAEDA